MLKSIFADLGPFSVKVRHVVLGQVSFELYFLPKEGIVELLVKGCEVLLKIGAQPAFFVYIVGEVIVLLPEKVCIPEWLLYGAPVAYDPIAS